MPIYCIDDGGDGSQTNSTQSATTLDWSKADTSVANLIAYDSAAFTTAGNVIYFADDHNDPDKAANWELVGPTAGAAVILISADKTNATPTYKAGTGNQLSSLGGAYDLTLNGSFRLRGITLNTGDDLMLHADGNEGMALDACTVKLSDAGVITLTQSAACRLINCTIDLTNDASGASALVFNGSPSPIGITGLQSFEIIGGSVTNASNRTGTNSALAYNIYGTFAGVDLSALPSAMELCSYTNQATFLGCKMPATFTAHSSGTLLAGGFLRLINCTAGTLNDHLDYYVENYMGTIVEDLGVTLDSGATADDGVGGTQQFSWKIVTDADCSEQTFMATEWIYAWNGTTGSRNLDIYVGAAETLDNAEIWAEYLYLGTDNSEQLSFASTQRVRPAAAATYSTTGGTWSGTGAPTEEYYLRSAVTVQEKGWVMGRICIGKASLTAWVDPRIVLS